MIVRGDPALDHPGTERDHRRQSLNRTIHFTRRAAAACIAAALAGPALAQDFSDRPIKLVVPYAAGGANDSMARAFAAELGPKLGTTMVVENRAGASGAIGAAYVASAPADGHTLLLGANAVLVVNPVLNPKLTYRGDSFAPIGVIAEIPLVLVTNPALPVKSLKDVVEYGKRSPVQMNFASPGQGTQMHLVGELFKAQTGIAMTHIPYNGSAPALMDVAAGQVQLAFDPVNSALPQIRAGKLRAIAVTGPKRAASLPDVPTVAEAGMPALGATAWFSIMAPAATPEPALARLRQALGEVLKNPAMAARLAVLGAEIPAVEPAQSAGYIEQERVRWTQIIRSAGIKGE
jgi:tripartite-type tricarboxylate transporter receptor subunit TctC